MESKKSFQIVGLGSVGLFIVNQLSKNHQLVIGFDPRIDNEFDRHFFYSSPIESRSCNLIVQPELNNDVDILVVSTKSFSLDTNLLELLANLNKPTFFIQNGLSHVALISKFIKDPIFCSLSNLQCRLVEDSLAVSSDISVLSLGVTKSNQQLFQDESLKSAFQSPSLNVKYFDDIEYLLSSKLVRWLPLSIVCCFTGKPLGEALHEFSENELAEGISAICSFLDSRNSQPFDSNLILAQLKSLPKGLVPSSFHDYSSKKITEAELELEFILSQSFNLNFDTSVLRLWKDRFQSARI